MSRLVKEDFGKLCTFIKEYGLSDVLENEDAKKLLSSFHKKYFAYLVLIEEIHQRIVLNDGAINMPKEQYEYLQESCSDLGQAFFWYFMDVIKVQNYCCVVLLRIFLKALVWMKISLCLQQKVFMRSLIRQKQQMFLWERKKSFMYNFIMSMLCYVKMFTLQMFYIWLP